MFVVIIPYKVLPSAIEYDAARKPTAKGSVLSALPGVLCLSLAAN